MSLEHSELLGGQFPIYRELCDLPATADFANVTEVQPLEGGFLLKEVRPLEETAIISNSLQALVNKRSCKRQSLGILSYHSVQFLSSLKEASRDFF